MVPVLAYHSIASATTRSFAALTVDPSLFEEHLAALREHGLDVIPFCEVPLALASGRDAVAISIDDGFADAGQNAAPALLACGLPATLFVPSGYVGGSSRWLREEDSHRAMLSWDALADLAQDGFEIGSHGRMHLAADVNSFPLVRRDALASRIELEDHLGRVVRSFAYPFGYHAGPSRRAVREAGFAQACAVGDLAAFASDDRWALPRLQVRGGTSAEAVLAMTRSRPSRLARGWSHAKERTWRAGRLWAGWGPPEARRVTGALQ
jgi:peptidoglycan/xylan/chitin deacetylase (PgdA/CDA1 family)